VENVLLRTGVALFSWFLAFAASVGPSNPAPAVSATRPSHEELLRNALADICWPTDAGRVVTSTFGEFRTSHFHAGIDISTDVTGYRVFGARDGYVQRISVAPNGYGKLLVVNHADGFSTAYAHLSRFTEVITARVKRAQDSLQRYPVNIICGPEEFPVRRGEVIAYTGDTGVGTPHLHFEVYDENGDPLNPLLCHDAETVDNLPPIIYNIAVIPVGEFSTVDGSWAPRVLRVGAAPQTQDILVHIKGSACFAVEARDFTNGTHFRRSTYRHTLTIDNRLFFATSLDRIDGQYPQQVGLHYDWPLLYDYGGRFERLFCKDSIRLPVVRETGPERGIIDTSSLTPGTHRFSVTSEDINGNATAFSGFFHLAPAEAPETVRPLPAVSAAGAGPRTIVLRHEFEEDYVHIILESKSRLSRPPVVEIFEGPSHRTLELRPVGPDRYAARIRPFTEFAGIRRVVAYAEAAGRVQQSDDSFALYPILPGKTGSYSFDNGILTVEYDSLSVFAPLFLRVEAEEGDSSYSIEPQTVVLREGIGITMRVPSSSPNTGLFSRRTGSWSLIGRQSEPGILTGRIRRAVGDLAALDDLTPPTITGISVGNTPEGSPDISFRYHDNLAGVDYDELKMYIDAKAVIPEVDGEHRRVTYHSGLAPGAHQVSIRLKDRLGNLSTEDRRFVIR